MAAPHLRTQPGSEPVEPSLEPNWIPTIGSRTGEPCLATWIKKAQTRTHPDIATGGQSPSRRANFERPLVLRLVERERRAPGTNPPLSFYILETKVWNGLYKAFADARPDKAGSGWEQGTWKTQSEADRGLLPVTNISAAEAWEFCVWCRATLFAKREGKLPVIRLPTKEEWDRAAAYDAWLAKRSARLRGSKGRRVLAFRHRVCTSEGSRKRSAAARAVPCGTSKTWRETASNGRTALCWATIGSLC